MTTIELQYQHSEVGNVSKLVFRSATEKDLPIIIEIYNSTIDSRMVTADTTPVSAESRVAWFRAHTPEHHPIWVAEIAGEICGWISFESFHQRPAYHQTAELSIYLHEGFRGQGLGATFLEKALTSCEQLQIRTLLGYIFAHNKPSLSLFRKFGFEQWAHFPKVAILDEVERDLIIVGKRVW